MRSSLLSILLVTFQCSVANAQNYFNADEIKMVSPRASEEIVSVLVENQSSLEESGINSRLRVAHFLAQVMTETGGLRRLDENMNYSAQRIGEVFSRSRLQGIPTSELARKPEKLANTVYGGWWGERNLGNRPGTSDGWNYRGSGYLQLTGRDNFVRRGFEVEMPLATDPDLARSPFEGLLAATAYWANKNKKPSVPEGALNAAADLNDRVEVRRLVNGGKHGLNASIVWFNLIWRGVYQDRAPFGQELSWIEYQEIGSDDELQRAVEGLLLEYGLLDDVGRENLDPSEYQNAIRNFQESRGMEATGTFDEETLYELTDPSNWKNVEELRLSETELNNPNGSAQHVLRSDVPTSSPLPVERGTGETANEKISADLIFEMADATATFSEYEKAKGRYDSGRFVPFTVIGEDEREIIPDSRGFPARAIVQILVRKTDGAGLGLCTGTMIGPDILLTAGHCVHSGTTHGQWFIEFTVIPGRNTLSAPFGRCKGVEAFALNGWVTSETNIVSRDYDLGAIRLDCDVGARTGWFGVRSLEDSEVGVVTRVQGYAGDRNQGRQLWHEDSLQILTSNKGFYNNDTAGGMSGSPVYVPEENMIYCVHTNGLHNGPPWNQHNACTRITPSRLKTISDWTQR